MIPPAPLRSLSYQLFFFFFPAHFHLFLFSPVGVVAVAILRPSHCRHGDGRCVGHQVQAVEKAALAVTGVWAGKGVGRQACRPRGYCRRRVQKARSEGQRETESSAVLRGSLWGTGRRCLPLNDPVLGKAYSVRQHQVEFKGSTLEREVRNVQHIL